MSAAGLVAAAVLVSLALGLLLAVLVWRENEREPMRRADAERRARRDVDETGDRGRSAERESRRR